MAVASVKARLAVLADELRRGQIVEARLRQPGYIVHGLCDRATGDILIDPAPATVSTLLHELLHRRYPDWPERRVRAEERRLLRAMSDADIARWYRAYSRRKRQRRPVAVSDRKEG